MKRAKEIRVREHRLKPGIRLRTIGDAVKFVHDEELVSFLGGNELPSFVSAALGRPWKPSKKGFTGWMDWWSVKLSGQPIAKVSRDLEGRVDILASRLFRRTKTLVSDKIWPILDPIIKHHKELVEKRKILSELEQGLLRTIENEGSIRTDQLRKLLKLTDKGSNSRFHRALQHLEGLSLIVGSEDPNPETHLHANIWQTYERRTDSRFGKSALTHHEALVKLFKNTIDACILVREDQINRWFRWTIDVKPIVQELLEIETVLRTGPYLIASRVQDMNS